MLTLGSALESSERPAAVVGHSPSGKSRYEQVSQHETSEGGPRLCCWIPASPNGAVPVLVELRFHSFVETVYAPAFAFAASVTPDAWGTQGNVLLGFGWLAFGAISYSVVVALLAGAAALLANQWLQSMSDARG